MHIKKDGRSILLCCGRGRCPTLKKSDKKTKHYELTDDFGGTVSLTKDHLLAIREALKELDDR